MERFFTCLMLLIEQVKLKERSVEIGLLRGSLIVLAQLCNVKVLRATPIIVLCRVQELQSIFGRQLACPLRLPLFEHVEAHTLLRERQRIIIFDAVDQVCELWTILQHEQLKRVTVALHEHIETLLLSKFVQLG